MQVFGFVNCPFKLVTVGSFLTGQLTRVDGPALLSITFVNVAEAVGPVEDTAGNIRSQSHRVRDPSLDHFKLSSLHVQQPDGIHLHSQQSDSITCISSERRKQLVGLDGARLPVPVKPLKSLIIIK